MPTSAAFSPSRAHHNLGDAFFEEVAAASFPSAVLRFRNQRWAERLGLGDLDGREWEAHFARFLPLAATFEKPLALKYHGHQFGVYNRDLGDGRGFLFAQLVDGASKRLLDLGTKGSGTTPWSRSGDGRLTLKGGVREIIATEMLEALDVPTSKTFSVFETGEKLTRGDEPSPTRSCVLVRLGHSHIRFGTFQRLAYERDRDAMVRLIDHIVQHHDPDIAGATDVPRALFGSIVRRTAILGAAWDVAGFVHGVLNTDNMNVMGESFDYGPYRFLVRRDPKFVAAYFDQTGLYAFGRQAETLRWNLGRLADAMRLVTPTTPLSAEIAPFEEMFRAERARRFVSRLGVRSEGGDVDEALAGAAFELLEKEDCRADDFWFDWHGGAASERRAMEGSRKLSYRGSRFDAFRRMLEVYSPVCKNALASPYFSRTAPVTAHIDAIEGVWRAIESTDDWTPLEALVADIRELGAQCGGPAPG